MASNYSAAGLSPDDIYTGQAPNDAAPSPVAVVNAPVIPNSLRREAPVPAFQPQKIARPAPVYREERQPSVFDRPPPRGAGRVMPSTAPPSYTPRLSPSPTEIANQRAYDTEQRRLEADRIREANRTGKDLQRQQTAATKQSYGIAEDIYKAQNPGAKTEKITGGGVVPKPNLFTGKQDRSEFTDKVRYDAAGRAYQTRIDENGRVVVENPDQQAKISSGKDGDKGIYFENKEAPWTRIEPGQALLHRDKRVGDVYAKDELERKKAEIRQRKQEIREDMRIINLSPTLKEKDKKALRKKQFDPKYSNATEGEIAQTEKLLELETEETRINAENERLAKLTPESFKRELLSNVPEEERVKIKSQMVSDRLKYTDLQEKEISGLQQSLEKERQELLAQRSMPMNDQDRVLHEYNVASFGVRTAAWQERKNQLDKELGEISASADEIKQVTKPAKIHEDDVIRLSKDPARMEKESIAIENEAAALKADAEAFSQENETKGGAVGSNSASLDYKLWFNQKSSEIQRRKEGLNQRAEAVDNARTRVQILAEDEQVANLNSKEFFKGVGNTIRNNNMEFRQKAKDLPPEQRKQLADETEKKNTEALEAAATKQQAISDLFDAWYHPKKVASDKAEATANAGGDAALMGMGIKSLDTAEAARQKTAKQGTPLEKEQEALRRKKAEEAVDIIPDAKLKEWAAMTGAPFESVKKVATDYHKAAFQGEYANVTTNVLSDGSYAVNPTSLWSMPKIGKQVEALAPEEAKKFMAAVNQEQNKPANQVEIMKAMKDSFSGTWVAYKNQKIKEELAKDPSQSMGSVIAKAITGFREQEHLDDNKWDAFLNRRWGSLRGGMEIFAKAVSSATTGVISSGIGLAGMMNPALTLSDTYKDLRNITGKAYKGEQEKMAGQNTVGGEVTKMTFEMMPWMKLGSWVGMGARSLGVGASALESKAAPTVARIMGMGEKAMIEKGASSAAEVAEVMAGLGMDAGMAARAGNAYMTAVKTGSTAPLMKLVVAGMESPIATRVAIFSSIAGMSAGAGFNAASDAYAEQALAEVMAGKDVKNMSPEQLDQYTKWAQEKGIHQGRRVGIVAGVIGGMVATLFPAGMSGLTKKMMGLPAEAVNMTAADLAKAGGVTLTDLGKSILGGKMKESLITLAKLGVATGKGIGKNALPEGIEEVIDNFTQSMVEKMSYNPNLTMGEIIKSSVEGGKFGVLMGILPGVVETMSKGRMIDQARKQMRGKESGTESVDDTATATPEDQLPDLEAFNEQFNPTMFAESMGGQPDALAEITGAIEEARAKLETATDADKPAAQQELVDALSAQRQLVEEHAGIHYDVNNLSPEAKAELDGDNSPEAIAVRAALNLQRVDGDVSLLNDGDKAILEGGTQEGGSILAEGKGRAVFTQTFIDGVAERFPETAGYLPKSEYAQKLVHWGESAAKPKATEAKPAPAPEATPEPAAATPEVPKPKPAPKKTYDPDVEEAIKGIETDSQTPLTDKDKDDVETAVAAVRGALKRFSPAFKGKAPVFTMEGNKSGGMTTLRGTLTVRVPDVLNSLRGLKNPEDKKRWAQLLAREEALHQVFEDLRKDDEGREVFKSIAEGLMASPKMVAIMKDFYPEAKGDNAAHEFLAALVAGKIQEKGGKWFIEGKEIRAEELHSDKDFLARVTRALKELRAYLAKLIGMEGKPEGWDGMVKDMIESVEARIQEIEDSAIPKKAEAKPNESASVPTGKKTVAIESSRVQELMDSGLSKKEAVQKALEEANPAEVAPESPKSTEQSPNWMDEQSAQLSANVPDKTRKAILDLAAEMKTTSEIAKALGIDADIVRAIKYVERVPSWTTGMNRGGAAVEDADFTAWKTRYEAKKNEQPEPDKLAGNVAEPAAETRDSPEFRELQELMAKRGQFQNKVKGVKFTKKDESRFQELGLKLRHLLFESVDPENDPVVGEDINDQPIRQAKSGTYYTVENGRIRTGIAFKDDPEYVREQNEILAKQKAESPAPKAETTTPTETTTNGQTEKQEQALEGQERDGKLRELTPAPAAGDQSPVASSKIQYYKNQIDESEQRLAEIEAGLKDWSSRRYKKTEGTLEINDKNPANFYGTKEINLGNTNERRRAAVIRNLKNEKLQIESKLKTDKKDLQSLIEQEEINVGKQNPTQETQTLDELIKQAQAMQLGTEAATQGEGGGNAGENEAASREDGQSQSKQPIVAGGDKGQNGRNLLGREQSPVAEPSVAKEYSYGMKARPFSIGAQPKGHLSVDEADPRARWGVVKYQRKLSPKELRAFELIELPDSDQPSSNDFLSTGVEPALTSSTDNTTEAKTVNPEVGDEALFSDPNRPDLKPTRVTVTRIDQFATDSEPMASFDYFGQKRVPLSSLELFRKSTQRENRERLAERQAQQNAPEPSVAATKERKAKAMAENKEELPPIERRKIDKTFERILKRKSTIPLVNGMFQVPYGVSLKGPNLRPTDRNEQSLRYRVSTKAEVTGDFNASDSRDTIIFDESVRGARAPREPKQAEPSEAAPISPKVEQTGTPALEATGELGGTSASPQVSTFSPDDNLIMHSPYTGEDTTVSYRGDYEGKAVIWTGKTQISVPKEWLRRKGEKRTGPTLEKESATTDAPISEVSIPAETEAQELPFPKGKKAMALELVGPKPTDYVRIKTWEKQLAAILTNTSAKLEEMVTDSRAFDKKHKALAAKTRKNFAPIESLIASSPEHWRKAFSSLAQANGIEGYVTMPDNSKGEETYRLAKHLAELGVDLSKQPVEPSEAPTPAANAEPESPARDASRPEQMTPEEFDALSTPKKLQVAAKAQGESAELDQAISSYESAKQSLRTYKPLGTALVRGNAKNDTFNKRRLKQEIADAETKLLRAYQETRRLTKDIENRKPVTVYNVAMKGITLPEGYVKRGELYVHEATPEQKSQQVPDADVARHSELEAKHNAGTITPAETAEAQKLVDAAAKAAGYNIKAFHGARERYRRGTENTPPLILPAEKFTTWSASEANYPAFYASLSRDVAARWAKLDKNVMAVYLRVNKTAKEGGNVISSSFITPEVVEKLKEQGFDSVEGGRDFNAPEIAVFNPNQIKSSDPFTGTSLDQRFSPESDDIRRSQEVPTKADEPLSMANDPSNARREARGDAPLTTTPVPNEVSQAMAAAVIAADSQAGREMAKEIMAGRKTDMTAVDWYVLLQDAQTIRNDMAAIEVAILEAKTEEAKQRLRARQDALKDDLYDNEVAAHASGTQSARFLQSRQDMIREDYSYVARKRKVSAALGRAFDKNNPEDVKLDAELEAQGKAHEEALNELIKARQEIEAKEATIQEQAAHIKALEDAEKARVEGANPETNSIYSKFIAKLVGLQSGAKSAVKSLFDGLRKSKDGGEQKSQWGGGKTLDDAIVTLAATYRAEGAESMEALRERFVRDFDEESVALGFDPHKDTLWEATDSYIDEFLDKELAGKSPSTKKAVKARVKKTDDPSVQITHLKERMKSRVEDGNGISNLNHYVQKVAVNLIRQGMTDRAEMMAALHAHMEDIIPGVTMREVSDAFSNYGVFKELPDDSALETKRIMQDLERKGAKISDMEQGKWPLNTGVERQTPTAEMREMTTQVNELAKKFAEEHPELVPESSAASKASIQQTIAKRLRNEIEELQKAIDTKIPRVNSKGVVVYDADNIILRDELKQKRKEYAEHFPKEGKKLTEAQKQALYEKNLAARIERMETMLAEGKIWPDNRLPWSPNIDETAEGYIATMKADLNALRAADTAHNEQKRIDKLREIQEYNQKRIATMTKSRVSDFKEKTPRPMSSDESKLRTANKLLRKEILNLQLSLEPKLRESKFRTAIRSLTERNARAEAKAAEIRAILERIREAKKNGTPMPFSDMMREADMRRQLVEKEKVAKAEKRAMTKEQIDDDARIRELQQKVTENELAFDYLEAEYADMQEGKLQKTTKIFNRIWRWNVLSGLGSLMHLSGAGVAGLTSKLLREASTFTTKIAGTPFGLHHIYNLTTHAGRNSPRAIGALFRGDVEAAGKGTEGGLLRFNTLISTLNKLSLRKTKIDKDYGGGTKARVRDTGHIDMTGKWSKLTSMSKTEIVNLLADTAGGVHGALKEPFRNAYFAEAAVKEWEAAVRMGHDPIKSEAIRMGIRTRALFRANGEIMMGDNVMSRVMIRAMKKAAMQEKYNPATGKFIANTIDFLFPVKTVPLNIMARQLSYISGIPVGLWMIATHKIRGKLKGIKDGTQTLTLQEAEFIAEQIRNGGVGLMALLTVWANAARFGGTYIPGQHLERKKKLKYGALDLSGTIAEHFAKLLGVADKKGIVDGHWLHDPLFGMMNQVVQMQRTYQHEFGLNDDGFMAGIRSAAVGVNAITGQIPLINAIARATSAYQQPGEILLDAAASVFTPGIAKGIAKWQDKDEYNESIVREPDTFVDRIKAGWPGYRKEVPALQTGENLVGMAGGFVPEADGSTPEWVGKVIEFNRKHDEMAEAGTLPPGDLHKKFIPQEVSPTLDSTGTRDEIRLSKEDHAFRDRTYKENLNRLAKARNLKGEVGPAMISALRSDSSEAQKIATKATKQRLGLKEK